MSIGTSNPYYDSPYGLRRLKRGPLAPYLDGFGKRLWTCGYSPSVGQNYIRCISFLSVWLEERGIEVANLNDRKVSDYVQYLKHHKNTLVGSSPYILFVSYLRETGVISRPTPKTKSKIDSIVDEYLEYLRRERGIAESTIVHRRLSTRRFLQERFAKSAVRVDRLKARDVIRHIESHAHEYSAIYSAGIIIVLRDFYRFLRLKGYVDKDIASGIPRMPYRKPIRPPSHLEPSDVERLLRTCDRKTPQGMRDYAIMLILARLGLRAGEVRTLTLDSIDWETGEITVCGKGARRHCLPLPQDIGKALVEYLKHGRPPCSSRHVFIRVRAPHSKLQCSGPIYKIVRKALERAGLHPQKKGPHLLRHTFATHLIRRGASLQEIGRMLGHEAPNSAFVYAHVDMATLKTVALPWPGGDK